MGAHEARLVRKPSPTSALLIVFILSIAILTNADKDSDALLLFKEALTNNSALSSWKPSTRPCLGNSAIWIGVLCYDEIIIGLQLEGMNLAGPINVDALALLHDMRTLSLMNNNFEGKMPNIKRLSSLKSLYLSNNRLSGEIPNDAFEGMGSLKKVLLANNAFAGKIPSSLTTLPRLLEVRMNGNQLQGSIPEFTQEDLKLVSFANNDLEGKIPESLSHMDPGAFAGNTYLCGPPLESCDGMAARPQSNEVYDPAYPFMKKHIPIMTAAFILVAIGLILAIISLICVILQWRKHKTSSNASTTDGTTMLSATYEKSEVHQVPEVVHVKKNADQGKLLFVNDDVEHFDLQELLRASAEVLGSGTFSASYKAAIMSGKEMVVKRYKQMNNVGRQEFHEHMLRLGRLRHPNVLPLAAYYYRREEKLLVTEFVQNSCLASHLHANHSQDQPGLDWATRLKIIKGVARGLSYLYKALPTLTIPHGHLKSSNVLLDGTFEPLLTDFGLRPLMNSERAHSLMIAYKSPEYARSGHISKKTDVWCLGIIILELLTGKFPENYLTQGYDQNANLLSWVSTMVKEKKTSEVFDKEMSKTKGCKGEMLNLLKIGLSCCEEDEDSRPTLAEAVEKIEELKEGGDHHDENNDELFSSTSEGNLYIDR